ncbi:hypothetical protein OIO90_003389 [Microbotryomycetes sp. JL221]|nr:hypothetical protein OIO90_003389 [Microbotryomycetes sp. JL221]
MVRLTANADASTSSLQQRTTPDTVTTCASKRTKQTSDRTKHDSVLKERGYVTWRFVSKQWRKALSSSQPATAWRNSNLTPNTLFKSFMFDRQAQSVRLHIGTINGFPELLYTTKQIRQAISYLMATHGVNKKFARDSFNPDWVIPAEVVKDVQRMYFKTTKELNDKLKQLSDVELRARQSVFDSAWTLDGQDQQQQHVSPVVDVNQDQQQPATRSDAGTALTTNKRPLDVAYPTPLTSLESTPEPPTLKKLKSENVQLSEAAQAKQALRMRQCIREYSSAQKMWNEATTSGGTTFLSIDFETWEFDHDCLLEVGWSLIEFAKDEDGQVSRRVEQHHAVVKDNKKRRNKRFAPDARDHYDYGQSIELKLSAVRNLLHALFSSLSESGRLVLVFHDPRMDLKALYQLGFEPFKLQYRLGHADVKDTGIYIVDTQSLYSAWADENRQTSLNACCDMLKVDNNHVRWHNAGNDAVATRLLLQALMDGRQSKTLTVRSNV